MGMIEQIAADVAEIKTMLAGMNAPAGAAKPPTAAEKKAAEKKAAEAAAAADKPSFTAEELRDKFIELQTKHGDVVAKGVIGDLGYDKLAKLIADTAGWQKAWDTAEAKIAEDAGDDDNGGL